MTSLQQVYSTARAQWDKLQASEVPVFFVGAATCGRAAGATEVLQALRGRIEQDRLNVLVVEVGCLGPCSFEPLGIVTEDVVFEYSDDLVGSDISIADAGRAALVHDH